jgi:hypothetical protein
METLTRILKMIVAVVIIATIAGLGWWFFFLRSQTSTITTVDAARGLNDVVPTFNNIIGSTYKNIVSNFTGSGSANTDAGTSSSQARLRQIDSSPIAGMGFVGTSTPSTLFYVQSTTGYILSSVTTRDEVTRVTNTLIPKLRDALFAADGSVIMRGVDERGNITTVEATINTTTATTSVETVGQSGPKSLAQKDLPKNIAQIAINGKTRDLLYLVADSRTGSTLTQAGWGNTKAKTIFTSPIHDWHITWLADNRIILAQKPSDGVAGYVYQLNTTTGVLTPLVRDIPGLTALPQDSTSAIIFSGSSGGDIGLYVASSSKAIPTRLLIKTVSEKCVWATGKESVVYCAIPQSIKSTAFLDEWHQGIIHTNDSWWRIDISTGSTTQLMEAHDTPIDVQRPIIDPRGEYIAFINGADHSLWLLRIKD